MLIGLLASILGIGGLANKVMGLIKKIRQRIVTAITAFWKKIKQGARKLLRKVGVGKKKKGNDKIKEEVKGKSSGSFEDIRESFKGDDKKTHTLYFTTQSGKTVLMVASIPTNFRDFIATIKPENKDERTKKAKEKATALANKIDQRKNDKTNGETAEENKKAHDISVMTKALSKYAGILFGYDKEGLPKSEIKHIYKTIGGGVLGTEMRATILTRKGPKGSTPKETNTVYEKLFSRLEGSRAYYVRGHLLNEHIGGPGTLINLTPLSQKGNKNHLRVAEEPIKIAVLGGAVVDYILSVRYGRNVPETSDAELEAAGFETEKQKETIRKVRANEKHVPMGLSLRSYYLKKEGDNYIRDKELVNKNSVLNPVDLSLNSYKINIERKEKVSLLHSSVEDITNNTPFRSLQTVMIKEVLAELVEQKKAITWKSILKKIKLISPLRIYNQIEKIIANRSELLKNVKLK